MVAVILPYLAAVLLPGDLFVDSQKSKHPFQHLIFIPRHELAYMGENRTAYTRLDYAVNGESVRTEGGWSSEFDANMKFAEFGLTFPAADNLYLTIALEAGDITDDAASLNRGATVYLPADEDLGASLGSGALSLKSNVYGVGGDSVSMETFVVIPGSGASELLSVGSISFAQSFMATTELFEAQFLSVNAGASLATGGYNFEESLRPALVRFFSASYTMRWGDFSAAAIYEASTALWRRPDTLNNVYSSVGLSAQFRTKTDRYFAIVSSGLGGESYDYSIALGYGWEL